MSMAGMLSQCLGSRSADDANRLMQPIVRIVIQDVQRGAKPATQASLTSTDADQVALQAFMRITRKKVIELSCAWLLTTACNFYASWHLDDFLL